MRRWCDGVSVTGPRLAAYVNICRKLLQRNRLADINTWTDIGRGGHRETDGQTDRDTHTQRRTQGQNWPPENDRRR